MLDRAIGRRDSLTALVLPLADRSLLLPNVAVAELIDYLPGEPVLGAARWHLGMIEWRNLRLPLVSFEAASGGEAVIGERARIVVLNALGETSTRFIAVLIQHVPRSCRVDSQLSYVDVPLKPLEMAAVQVGETVARVPDLTALENLLYSAV
ncbi:chemotaxis protein CheW [Pseudomonas sp. CFBP 13727]|uniref:chemotaxis protein CheW n=1 Tax=Pseudomonas sp. CFBP 13727 TaxID=2775295 RepID=UPI001781269F|nr:chemotaxis protein CheW [Pseudomonas sp. CFBP 13727]MBD8624059.1 chemotaxis protein CheW [Pseudomonas sp. CFBP 13727]